jgi:hypothetical protein
MRSKNPLLSFRNLSGVAKDRSDSNTHVRRDRFPDEALCALRDFGIVRIFVAIDR